MSEKEDIKPPVIEEFIYYDLNEDAYYKLCEMAIGIIKDRYAEKDSNWTQDKRYLGSDKKVFSNTHIRNLVLQFFSKTGFDHDFYFDVRMEKYRMGLLPKDDVLMGPKEYYKKQKEVIEKCVNRYTKETSVEDSND